MNRLDPRNRWDFQHRDKEKGSEVCERIAELGRMGRA